MPYFEEEVNGSRDVIAVARKSLQEIFVEGCGSLYNDLLDAIDDIDSGEDVCESEFHERLTHLMEEGTQLSESLPDLSNMISLRLSTVSRAMEQLKIKQDSESKKEKNTSPTSSLPQLRKWLKSTEVSIKEIEEQLTYPRGLSLQNLKRLLASQQVIQLHVETEGSSLVHTAKQQIDSRAFATNAEKKSKSLEVLTEKWHLIWLRSLGLQARIEKLIERREDKSESDSEGETSEDEPERKRRRTLSGSDLENPLDVTPTTVVAAEEDTIPFRADEYESIGADDDDETEPDAAMMTKAESETEAPKDRGYSSGENSMHESTHTLGDDEQRRLRIDASPVKSYYKTVPLDDAGVTDTETPRGMASCVSWPLEIKVDSGVDMTDSMIVNAESPPKVDDKYYLEVMQIMDECDEPHIDHFKNNLDNLKKGTEWREFKPPTRRISSSRSSQSKLALSRSISEKTSCDASSEESDDQHNKTLESWIPNDVGSTPVNYHIAMTRKRQRKRNTGSFLSEGLKHSFNNMTNSMFLGTDLNASIYASPEELMSQSFNSTVTSASRRRFGRRRMGRSNSDACFLSVSAIPLFQSTPNSRGSRRHVSGGDSDTTSSAAYEPSDTPAYEWDDYKPEAKDESTISVGDFLTAVHSTPKMNDDDYGLQLNGTEADVNVPAVCEMLTESKNHLNNALKMLSNPENDCNARNAVRVCAQSNIHRLVAIVNANPRMKQDMNDEICKVEEEWKTVLGSLEDPQPSPRPPSDPRQSTPELKLDLSAYQKLADTLRSSFLDESYIDSFKSIDDVDNMIRVYHKIHERLKEERNSFEVDVQKELARLGEIECDDLQELLKECDKCLLNIADTTSQLETLKENWLQWTKLGSSVESTMQDLECRLNNFGNSTATSEMIYEELEDCQNRMGHLETVCNFLTAHLNELSARPCSGYDHTDFAAEFKKYSGELEKIKMRYENLIADEKLNSTTSTVSVGTSTSPRKRRQAKTKSPSPVRTVTARPSIAKRIVTSIRTSIPIQILLGLTLLVAIGAFLYSYSDERPINRWRNSFGPHLDYVRGPPPV
ncbi:hypothetical protein QR680_006453 [Steinernema hermaphroditum]|uniref:KASH domain-containing protein n=1 Tax=Steinernema hermaphroditum TaxID=289476 RepID=A0AA39LWK4_9BILA|nr:hypothetical protein QR680_006453 [Steinernema hermaphroditum]